MNRVIHHELKASDLPAELRGDIDPDHLVRVVVEDIGEWRARRAASVERILALTACAPEREVSIAEAVERVRALRDEWD